LILWIHIQHHVPHGNISHSKLFYFSSPELSQAALGDCPCVGFMGSSTYPVLNLSGTESQICFSSQDHWPSFQTLFVPSWMSSWEWSLP
jgi:hypothetical protein